MSSDLNNWQMTHKQGVGILPNATKVVILWRMHYYTLQNKLYAQNLHNLLHQVSVQLFLFKLVRASYAFHLAMCKTRDRIKLSGLLLLISLLIVRHLRLSVRRVKRMRA